MADIETGLQYPVGVYPDEKSVIQTTNKITKDVLNQFKDGHLDVPVALATPFDKNNKKVTKELIEAQAAFIDEYNQLSAKGFSASAKELKNFVKLYDEYKRQIRNTGQTGSKQNLAFRDSGLNEVFQSYKKQMDTLSKDVAKSVEENGLKLSKTTRNLISLPRTNSRKTQQKTTSQERNRQEDTKLREELNRGASRAKASSVGAPINLGIRSPIMDGAYVDKDSLKASDISPYMVVDESRRAKELRKIRAEERKNLKKKIDKNYEIGGEDNKIGLRGANRSQSGTEYELIKRALLTEVAKIQGGLIKGKSGVTSQELIDQVFANLAYDEEQDIDPLKSIMSIHNMLQKRYDTKGKIGITDGTPTGEGPHQEETNETLKAIYDILGQFIEARQSVVNDIQDIRDSLSGNYNKESLYSRELSRIMNSEQIQALKQALTPTNGLLTRSLAQSVRESTREGVADNAAGRASRTSNEIASDVLSTVTKDANTGFNTDEKANELTTLVKNILSVLGEAQFSDKNSTLNSSNEKLSIRELFKKLRSSTNLGNDQIQKILATELNKRKTSGEIQRAERLALPSGEAIVPPGSLQSEKLATPRNIPNSNMVEKSTIYASPFRQGFLKGLDDFVDNLIGTTKEYDKILKANADEQDAMAAERIKIWGLNNGRNPNDTGDIAGMRRILQLYRTNKDSIEQNPELAQRIQLTPGRVVDTTKITEALNRVLSGKQMQNAQTGGSFLKNLFGYATGGIGYAFMPSIEKSRAQADGLNQIFSDINNALQSVLVNIQTKETELKGMEARGDVKFNEQGFITEGTSAAYKTLADLEEEKLVLDTIQADLLANDKIIKRSRGNINKLVKNLSFASPVLKDSNGILRNLNSGLDKSGKALKFQTRLAEILNYSYQLMSRHIGQILKNWLWMINPLNLIKKVFDDFASYDSKWQRTMNVIKYNLRDVVRPFVEWLAQSLINIIGFLDIISMKIQEAFGYTPISLFDQKNADEMKKTYEEISDISAGFDELHDIGSTSSENDPENLLGEIYKPQLSQAWKDLASEIGDLFAGIITGDLGFSEVMLKILDIAWKGVKTLWNEILWPFIKNTIWPAIKDNWLEILAWILGAFVAWKGLKLIGQLLWNAISGAFIKGAGTNLLKNLFTDSNGIVGIGRNLGTLIAGGILTVISTMALTDAINDAWNQGKSDANTGQEMNLNDQQTNMDALKGALGGAGAVLGGGMIATALGASVALGPLLAVAAGVAALSAVVVVGAEAWAYHSQQNKIANNEMLKASDYAEQAAATQEKLNEVTDMVNNGLEIKNSNQEKLNQLEEEYGISLDYVNQKVEAAGGNTSILTEKERALYEQGKLTQESIDNYNRLLEIQIELQKQQLWQKEQEAIALDMEAGNYELATLRIEQAELQGLITTEEATAKRIQLYKTCGEEERANLLQNLTPEQRTLMTQYTNATDEELAELAKLWRESSEDVKQSLLDGVGPEVQAEFERRMDDIDKTIKEHQGFWQGVGDTLKEIFTAGNYTSWTYNGEEKYYKEGYDKKWAESEIQSIQNDDTLSEEEKRRRIQNIRDMASYAVGTNYVPNDGLAYLHQGEAVIPKKYNQPYQPASMSPEEVAYMNQMMNTMRSLDNTMKQGITVNGQFVQRGSDLVSVINRTKSQSGADLLSNVSYAR